MEKKTTILEWSLTLVVAIILLQTLFFKFTASEESVYIFTKVGVEPYGRIGSGIVELLASVLLFLKRVRIFGALIAAGTMFFAILTHLFMIGINVLDDGGTLFTLAIITFVCSVILVYRFKNDYKIIGKRI